MRLSLVVVLLLRLASLNWAQYQQTNMTGLHVIGNKIVNSENKTVQLRGVNRPGTEYSCVQYGKIFDGPSDQASIDSIKLWKINSIRVPINEDCWLGTGGVEPSLSGSAYVSAISDYVTALTNSGLAVVVDLHWSSSSPGTQASHKQTPMPNSAQSPNLWTSVANTFKANLGVIFDIFNEPFPDNNAWNSDAAWNCWRDAQECDNMGYDPAGMQWLVNAIRETGSQNIIMAGGIQYATSLTRWLDYKLYDPTGNLAAAIHVYDFNFCRSRGCWDIYWTPVLQQVPLIAGEFGETDCATSFVVDFMNYADSLGIHYLAWAWLPSDCALGPSLISDFDGTATNYGSGVQKHLDQLSTGNVDRFPHSFPMFTDSRSYMMDDWSDLQAVRWLNETQVVHSGSRAIKFQPTIGSYLFLQCWSCINTSLHKGIEFWINGGSTESQDVQFVLMKIPDLSKIGTPEAISNEAIIFPINSLTSSGIVANTWTKVYLDLSRVPAGTYDGVRFRADTNEETFYLDDMMVYEKDSFSISNASSLCYSSLTVILLSLFLWL